MPIVYMATNVVNGKRYIGATKHSLDHRRTYHLNAAHRKQPGCRVFGSAIRKYGSSAFAWSVLSVHNSIDDMINAEVEAIKSLRPEYNMTAGGRGLIGLERTPEWIAKAAAANRGKKRTQEQIAKIKAANKSKNYKKIICLDDGLVHESVKAAAAYYGISKKGISEVCCGRGLSVKNKHFAHYCDGFSEAKRLELLADIACKKHHQHVASARVRSRPVICVTDGKRFTSGIAAAKAYGLHASAIMYFCQSGGQSRSGLRFMYADQGAPVEKTPEQKVEILARKRASALRMSKVTSKGVICLEDGSKYASISDAARAIGKHTSLLSAAIHRNGKCGGMRFAFEAA